MPRRQHHRVIGFLGALTENLFRDGDSVRREVDVTQVIFPDPVGAHHEKITGADRNSLCRTDFRYPVADDAPGETGTGPDMDTAGRFGHQIGGDVADPVHVSVFAAKSTRANVIATPLVPVSSRWQSWIRTSSRSELLFLTASIARSAASAAAGP